MTRKQREAVGDRVRRARGVQTQVTYARRLRVSQQRLSSIERGKVPIPPAVVYRMARLGVDLNWLFMPPSRK